MPRQRLQDGTASTADASTRCTTRLRHSSPGTRGTRETYSGGATTAGWAVFPRLRAGAADRRCDRRRGVEARRHRGAGRLHDRVPGAGRAFGSIRRRGVLRAASCHAHFVRHAGGIPSGISVARCARPLHPRRRAPASGSAPFCPHTQPTRAPRSVTGRYREPAHRSRRRDAAPLRRHRS